MGYRPSPETSYRHYSFAEEFVTGILEEESNSLYW